MWIPKSIKIAARKLLRHARRRDRNAFTVGKRAPSGGNSGRRERRGNRSFAPVPGPGGRLVGPVRLGDWPAWHRGADEGLLHLIHGGAPRLCLISPSGSGG